MDTNRTQLQKPRDIVLLYVWHICSLDYLYPVPPGNSFLANSDISNTVPRHGASCPGFPHLKWENFCIITYILILIFPLDTFLTIK
uniref:Uncharacterized protein n=1 Tax=Corvus moneduloides TaxID=1196302 RepID=A0A8C3GUX0_CORMO